MDFLLGMSADNAEGLPKQHPDGAGQRRHRPRGSLNTATGATMAATCRMTQAESLHGEPGGALGYIGPLDTAGTVGNFFLSFWRCDILCGRSAEGVHGCLNYNPNMLNLYTGQRSILRRWGVVRDTKSFTEWRAEGCPPHPAGFSAAVGVPWLGVGGVAAGFTRPAFAGN